MPTVTHLHIINMHGTFHSFLFHYHTCAWVVAESKQKLLLSWTPIGSHFANWYYIIYETHKALLNKGATNKTDLCYIISFMTH